MEVDAKLMFTRIFDARLGVDVVLCERKCEEIPVKEFQNIRISKRPKTPVAVD